MLTAGEPRKKLALLLRRLGVEGLPTAIRWSQGHGGTSVASDEVVVAPGARQKANSASNLEKDLGTRIGESEVLEPETSNSDRRRKLGLQPVETDSK